MVVFGSKSSSAKTKLFDQPLDKLFNPKAIKDFNETIAASNSRSPPALCQSLSAPLTSSTMTWAKLSQENSATKRKRAAARLRRFTIDANNNTSSLIQSLTSAPIISPSGSSALPLCISHPHQRLESNHSSPTLLPGSMLTNSSFVATNCEWNEREVASREENQRRNEGELSEDERCRLLLNVLPEPIKCLLNEIYHRGPSTVGIFRKSPNAKHCKELKQKLESSDFQLDAIEQYQVNVIASVFKEWLRSLPDCLLMSRLYPQWIDVAKLIEPLHSHLQQQQQQQQQLMQQSNDHTPSQNHLSSSSSCEDNLDGNLSKSPNGVQEMASLRSSVLAASPLTDNGQQQSSSESLSPGDGNRQQLSRALSCSIMTSDSGHSSTSTSPSSAMSTSFDSCNETISATEAAARARRQNFQKAQIQSQQLQANQKASYLKRKCYQQRQQQQLSSIDCKSECGPINSLISGNAATDKTQQSNQHRQQVSMSMEFSLRERRFECIRVVRQLLEALNETNLILLRAIICVLWHIADNSDYNKMSSNNLGVCIGQSLLNDELQQQQQNNSLQHRGKKLQSFSLSISTSSQLAPTNLTPDSRPAANSTKRHRRARSQCLLASTLSLTNLSHLSTSSSPTNSITLNGLQLASSISSNYLDSSGAQETAKFVPILVAFMIDNAKELFGSDVMNLFGPRKSLQVTDNDVNREQRNIINESMVASNHHTKQSVGLAQTSCTVEEPIRNGQDERPGLCDDSLESKSIIVTRDQTQPHCSDLVVKLSSDSSNNNNQAQQPISSPGQVHLFPESKPVLVMHVGNQMEALKTSDQVTSRVGDVSVLPVNSEIKREPASDATTSILIVNTPKKQALNQVLNLDPRATSDIELNHKQPQDLSSSCASQASDSIPDEDLSTKRRRQQQQKFDSQPADSFHVDCGGRRQCRTDSSSSSSPLIVANVDSDEHDEREAKVKSLTSSQREHKQQRPLSATESTTSSSRASSSTSGVHSESPAFSCERDSNSSASYSSVSPHNNASARTTNTCSPTSSRCVSISPPSSSSSSTAHSNCTSPIEMDHSSVDVVDGNQHLHRHHLSGIAGDAAKTISHNEAMRHNLTRQVRSPQTLAATTVQTTSGKDGDSVPVCESRLSSDRDPARGRRLASFERPKSMVSLNRPSEMGIRAGVESLHQPDAQRYLNDGQVSHQRYSSMAFDAVDKENVGYVFDSSSRGQPFQSHTLNRHTSTSSQLVNINRMPKLPFQYTTSCYGGEAVLFYPPNAHLSQQQQQQHRQQHQSQATALHQHRDQFGTPSAQPRGCNRIQSLDRLTQLQHSSSHLHQQQPQRSHVMMLRDYYLSLQEQSQRQQQYRELMKRHQCKQQMPGKEQRPSVTNAPKISSHFQLIHQQQSQPSQQQYRQQVLLMAPAPVDPRQQPARSNVTTNLNAMQTSNDATKTGCNGNHELMREQPASVAVAHQRVQPRTARIRPNQFSGLYVKRATSPMHMDLGNANLITLDHHHNRHQTSSNACKPLASGGNSTSNLMAVSQSSLSQQSSKMSSSGHSSDEDERDCSSDECFTGGWMESTLV